MDLTCAGGCDRMLVAGEPVELAIALAPTAIFKEQSEQFHPDCWKAADQSRWRYVGPGRAGQQQ